jgi:hypothetical protein
MRQVAIKELENRIRRISQTLYDTRISEQVIEEQVLPWLTEDVTFTDPWQHGKGLDVYRRGAAAFHCMLRFNFDVFQVNVQLDEPSGKGRAIVDGVMHLRQLEWLYTYPLRTILVYRFNLLSKPRGEVQFLIHEHEEMWSLGDMIEAVPGFGWFYKHVFRKGFSYGFLAAGALCRQLKRSSNALAPLLNAGAGFRVPTEPLQWPAAQRGRGRRSQRPRRPS